MTLKNMIIDKIAADGPLCFHDFMEMALYYPGAGYYSSPGEKIGGKGDYFTSPCLGNIFGNMVGKQMEEMWAILNEPLFTIVEYGAGDGTLCYDVLTYLQQNKKLYNGLTYCIIEKSPLMIEKEKTVLKDFSDKIKWIRSINETEDITGCIFQMK
jgi:SAM-dependent MidA family methyltransferase